MGVTKYNGLFQFYGDLVLRQILRFSNIENRVKILDFGCGNRRLELVGKKFPNLEIIGFDIEKSLSQISNWENQSFQVFVANHVLMYLEEEEIVQICQKLRKKQELSRIIIGIGTQGILSRMLKTVLLRPKAHEGTKTTLKQQVQILENFFTRQEIKNIFFLTRIYVYEL
jgi:hypothetical protein